eukprot:36034-Eustigmatos_ZCMA.PRE.1
MQAERQPHCFVSPHDPRPHHATMTGGRLSSEAGSSHQTYMPTAICIIAVRWVNPLEPRSGSIVRA